MNDTMNQKVIQRLIIAGNNLCAAIDTECETSDENRQRALETWEITVQIAQKSIPKPRTVWVKAAGSSQ